jgi:hypothetical protein
MQLQRISTLLVILGVLLIVEPVMAQRPPFPPPAEPLEPPRLPARRNHDFDRSERRDERLGEIYFEVVNRLDDILSSGQSEDLRDSLRDGKEIRDALMDLDLSDWQREEIRDVIRDINLSLYRRNRYRSDIEPPLRRRGFMQRSRGSGRFFDPSI